MIDSFIKLPEIQINDKSLFSFILDANDSDWNILPWGQSVFYNWKKCNDIKQLASKFSKHVNFSLIECMRFDSNKSLPIHKDGKRTAVIQIPLSNNCQSTPTLFYNDNKELIDKIEWTDGSAWMFDTHRWHSIHNTSDESRYTLCISFYGQTYIELLKLYKSNQFFKIGQNVY